MRSRPASTSLGSSLFAVSLDILPFSRPCPVWFVIVGPRLLAGQNGDTVHWLEALTPGSGRFSNRLLRVVTNCDVFQLLRFSPLREQRFCPRPLLWRTCVQSRL